MKNIELIKKYSKLYKALKRALDENDIEQKYNIINKLTSDEMEEMITFMKKFIGIRAYELIKFVDDNLYYKKYDTVF